MRGMARGYAAGDSRGPGWREFAGTLGKLQAGRQAGNGMACSRAKARLNWVSQGQRRGRCNTGIATYVWLLTNRKAPERQGKVQFIDASSFWAPMRQSLGDKRRQITPERAEDILKLLLDYRDGETCVVTRDGSQGEAVVSRVFPASHFGFRKITVERPLSLSFLANPRLRPLPERRSPSDRGGNIREVPEAHPTGSRR